MRSTVQGVDVPFDLKQIEETAHRAVEAAAKILTQSFGQGVTFEEKPDESLVSAVDRETEQVLANILTDRFPEFEFLGEETSGSLKSISRTSEKGRWILDPLDGTTNYLFGFPAFGTSLAFEWRGQILHGITHFPVLRDTYTATLNQGAFLNKKRIKVSARHSLKETFLATGFSNRPPELVDVQVAQFSEIVRLSRGVRRAGSAAYDLSLAAAGVFDGYWEANLKPWDVAAGLLLVREAGGEVLTYGGVPYKLFDSTLIAGNAPIVKAISEVTVKNLTLFEKIIS